MLEPAGAGATVTVSAAAGAPRPTGVGTHNSSDHARTGRYRGGGAAEREAAPGQSGAVGAA